MHKAREGAPYNRRQRKAYTMPARDQAMSARQFNLALKKLDLNFSQAAPILGLSLRQVFRYSNDAQPVPLPVAKLVEMLVTHGIPKHWR